VSDAAGGAAAGAETWTVRRVLQWAADDLRGRGVESPRLEAELLLAMVLRLDRIGLVLQHDRPLAKDELAAYRALHVRRRAGEPVAYLRGEREFYGRTFRVDRRVLVPRPETELLVEVALERTRHLSLDLRALDLCTGSGCVAITIAKERPTARVLGTDVSEDALVVARLNAQRLGALPAVAFRRSDLFADLGRGAAPFDLVTANPPYVAEADRPTLDRTVVDFEPHLALFAGSDGLDVIDPLVAGAPAVLAPGGVLALEVGAGQAGATAARMRTAGLVDVAIRRDYSGIERIVSGRREGA
jgi:release factor glutamine methyltransferase